ncbi:Ubiquitin-conjugating enzyme E2 2 [Apostasia shenzhenica]|uniref:Ubiquitin-conjugating enzyme E2 2 n=1 Tax=Apostasia shenzhenica TaxID=1088818 RepID=A0A2H9ZR77_9ASPA|nr:Ubiquitin-conjugating enzyme E2 2 [Apostasia shenzhenica]
MRKKLMRDFKRLQQDSTAGISGTPQDNNMMLWHAVIFGPDNIHWDGGTFKLIFQFTEDYPNKLLTVQFVARMFHSNIYADGTALLTFIPPLLCDLNPNSLANFGVVRMFTVNKREYNRRVKEIIGAKLNNRLLSLPLSIA